MDTHIRSSLGEIRLDKTDKINENSFVQPDCASAAKRDRGVTLAPDNCGVVKLDCFFWCRPLTIGLSVFDMQLWEEPMRIVMAFFLALMLASPVLAAPGGFQGEALVVGLAVFKGLADKVA